MIQKGIFNISQLILKIDKGKGLKNQAVSISLYKEAGALEKEKAARTQEFILENFSFADGSYKKTHRERFNDFDDKILDYLKNNFPVEKTCRVHDLAASDGRTALDFFNKLEKTFPALDFFASDKNIFVEIFADKKNGNRKIIKDSNGRVLQLVFPPFVLNRYSPKRALAYKIKKILLYPINLLLILLFLNPFWQKIFFKINPEKKEKIALISEDVRLMEKLKNNFHFVEYDIFKKSFGKFEIIRAMNILNPSYFSRIEIKKIADNILSSLEENGLFITGSNQNAGSEVRGEIFIKKNRRFNSVLKIGNGATFRDVLLLSEQTD
jgi:hypothetical protein